MAKGRESKKMKEKEKMRRNDGAQWGSCPRGQILGGGMIGEIKNILKP